MYHVHKTVICQSYDEIGGLNKGTIYMLTPNHSYPLDNLLLNANYP